MSPQGMSARLRAVFIDLSGTLHIEDSALPGAAEALTRLRGLHGLHIRFVTNTTKLSRASLLAQVQKLELDVRHDELCTSLLAARHYVESRKLRPLLFLADDALKDFAGMATEDPNAVVIGLAPSKFDYTHLNQAFRLLHDGQGRFPLVAIHRAKMWASGSGMALGPGAFIAGLEHAADIKAIEVGKPNQAFFQAARATLPEEIPFSQIAMVGDDVDGDVGGAVSCGMRAILVRTGKYRGEMDDAKVCALGSKVRGSGAGGDDKENSLRIADDIGKAVDVLEDWWHSNGPTML